jgi:hypothetical protein
MAEAVRRTRRLRGERGQVLSEYVSLLGMMVATVILCMAAFISPVAAVYVRLFKRLVLYFTSP